MTFINWIIAHWAILVPCLVAIIDFIMGVSPSIASNGILHAIYLFLKGNESSPPKLG